MSIRDRTPGWPRMCETWAAIPRWDRNRRTEGPLGMEVHGGSRSAPAPVQALP